MRLALPLACALVATPALADEPPLAPKHLRAVDRVIDEALQDDVAYSVIESLTTEVGPRLAGTPAEARARAWAKKKLTRLGFSNVRIEPFRMQAWTRGHEHAEIVTPFPQKLIVTALGNSVATPEAGVTGEVVRFRTLLDLKEAKKGSLQGKIAFVDEFMTRAQDGTGYGMAVAKRSGAARFAAERGAIAALIRSVGTDHVRRPHTGVMRYAEGVTPIPIGALSAPDADQVTRALKRGPVTVRLRLHTEGGGRTGKLWAGDPKTMVESGNVIAEIPGRTNEIVIVGAHLDSWDLGTGALDDGAGVGIVVAAALQLKRAVRKPRRTIRVVLFGAEEVGLGGARAYVDAHADELDRHVMGAEADFGARKIWLMRTGWGEGAVKAHYGKFLRAFRRLGVADHADNDAWGGPDMYFMKEKGVPMTNLTQNGWDYFDFHHTPDDTFDKVDLGELRQNVAVYAGFLYLVSELGLDFRQPLAPAPQAAGDGGAATETK